VINMLDTIQPTPNDIFGARHNAKLTQQQAADLIGYSRRGWQDAENGKNKLHPAAWALFLLAIGQHPSHQVIKSKDSK
jgi:DNA-binding transcriptional regulator YiaG